MTEYSITLDIQAASSPVALNVKENDTGRRIRIALREGGVPYQIKPGSYAVFAGTKPDGKILWNPCEIKGNHITYELTEQTVIVPGVVPVQIRLYNANGKLITSPDFTLLVEAPVVRDSEVAAESENEILALATLIGNATQLMEDLRNFAVSDERIEQAVAEYMEKHPVSGGSPNAVLYTPQKLTEEQQAQARQNIGSGSSVHIDTTPPDDKSLLWVDLGDNDNDDMDGLVNAVISALPKWTGGAF